MKNLPLPINSEVYQRLNDIKDLRHDAGEAVKRSKEAERTANNADHRSDITNKRLTEAIKDGDQLAEVQAGRVNGVTGEVYDTLPDRLDSGYEKLVQVEEEATNNRPSIVDVINSDKDFEVNHEIPSLFSRMIDRLADSVSNRMLNIGFITDVHWEDTPYAWSSLSHYKYMAELTRRTRIDAVISGGDNVNGNMRKARIIKHNGDAVSLLQTRSLSDVFFLKGNHDDGSYWSSQSGTNTLDEVISPDELKVLYGSTITKYGEVRQGDSLYFYKDYTQHKIRVIGLDSYDLPFIADADGKNRFPTINISGFQNRQLNWLAKEALMLPNNDWHVIIFSHAPINGAFTTFDQRNDEMLLGILQAFRQGSSFDKTSNELGFPASVSVDYQSQGPGTIIAFVSGHLHVDERTVYQGIQCIQTLNSLTQQTHASTPPREDGTEAEDAWDVFSIDRPQRQINIHRFGAGQSRQYVY